MGALRDDPVFAGEQVVRQLHFELRVGEKIAKQWYASVCTEHQDATFVKRVNEDGTVSAWCDECGEPLTVWTFTNRIAPARNSRPAP